MNITVKRALELKLDVTDIYYLMTGDYIDFKSLDVMAVYLHADKLTVDQFMTICQLIREHLASEVA